MKKYYLAATISVILFAGNVTAQKNGSGVYFYPGAVTAKHFFRSNIAGEGLCYFYGNPSVRLTALLEFHFDINTVPGLKWYTGPGVHLSFTRDNGYANTFAGIDGVLGLDYKFSGAPIDLSVSWQPSFEFGDDPRPNDPLKDGPGFTGSWAGVGVRYVF